MPAFAPGQARGLIAPQAHPRARYRRVRAACRLGLFLLCIAVADGCVARDPLSIATSADARTGSGVYRWLAEHDPSGLVVVGIDPATARAVAPDARVWVSISIADGCRRAHAGHALLAAFVRARTPQRDRADDCGFAVFRDATAIVVAPR